jgi:hypothetical protein
MFGIDINCLYNNGEIVVTSETIFSEKSQKMVIVYQLQHHGEIIYRGLDKDYIKHLKTRLEHGK